MACRSACQTDEFEAEIEFNYDPRPLGIDLVAQSDAPVTMAVDGDGTMTRLANYLTGSKEFAKESSSGVGGAKRGPVTSEVQATTTFHDEEVGHQTHISVAPDPLLADAHVIENADLNTFFSRPVMIDNFIWNETDAVATKYTLKPWYLYINSPIIQRKASNFAYIRGNLKIKFVVNASPFYAGLLNSYYIPLTYAGFNGGFGYDTAAASGSLERIPISQLPNVWIFPTKNAGAELTCPFFYQKNFINLTSATDLQNMGTLVTYVFNQLQSANGATGTGVNVSIYAWMEDVQLSGPTLALSAQGEKPSVVASSFATSIGMLKEIPFIGNLATTTSLGLRAASAGLRALGYSNNPVTKDMDNFRSSPFPQFSNADVSYPSEKLTLDVGNELTIDPTTVGLPPVDEMNINSLVQKESWLGIVNWPYTTQSYTVLCGGTLCPGYLYAKDSSNTCFQTLPCWLGQAFDFWRGDIIIRLEVIATQYHRGRLLFCYDPYGQSGTTNNIFGALATQEPGVYTQILDIGVETEYEIRIPYTSSYPWCKMPNLPSASALGFTTSPSFAHTEGQDIGQWALLVLNELSAPTSTPNVDINVYFKGAENFEYMSPHLTIGNHANSRGANVPSYFVAQGAPPVVSSTDVIEVDRTGAEFGSNMSAPPSRFLVNGGERVSTLKQLMRRSTYYLTLGTNTGATDYNYNGYSWYLPHFPVYYGYDTNGLNTANKQSTGTYNFNFSNMSYINWFGAAFAAYRGSLVYTLNTRCESDIPLEHISVQRTPYAGFGLTVTGYNAATISESAASGLSSFALGEAGMALTNSRTQSGLSVHVPFYSRNKMASTAPPAITSSTVIDYNERTWGLTIFTQDSAPDMNKVQTTIYVAAGTDFQLFFFLAVPPVYVYSAWPTAP